MKFAILCPGPSLIKTAPLDGGFDGPVIGVNRAAIIRRCNVWVAQDHTLVTRAATEVIGSPILLTSPEGIVGLRERPWRGRVLSHSLTGEYCPSNYQWEMFSSTVALTYAGYCGANEIHAYGCDWNGSRDFDGDSTAGNRSDDRWTLERNIWNNVAAWLEIPVIRHGL